VEAIQALCQTLAGGFRSKVKVNEPMSNHTTFGIGGPADCWVEPEDIDALQHVLDQIQYHGLPYMMVGEGSNLLVSDDGIRGVVIRLGGEFRNIQCQGTTLVAGAAATIKELSDVALKNELDGVASICGIPGALGGGIVMNAGAYGGTLSDTLTWVETVEPGGSPSKLYKEEITFGYRQARELVGKVVTSMSFQLTKGNLEAILAEMDHVTRRRNQAQPLEWPSAGSVFKRPPGDYAGRILEAVGAKGFSIGGAEVSTKHANFIINKGNATAKDVLAVIKELRRRVQDACGIHLELEIKKVGFGPEEEEPQDSLET
jgi:UDP-N-acetylmuramate dehydrogenase